MSLPLDAPASSGQAPEAAGAPQSRSSDGGAGGIADLFRPRSQLVTGAMSFLHTCAGAYLVRYLSKALKLCGSVSTTNTIPVSAPAMCAS